MGAKQEQPAETISRSYKYRLYPTAEQARILSAWQQACWEVQQACVLHYRWADARYQALKGMHNVDLWYNRWMPNWRKTKKKKDRTPAIKIVAKKPYKPESLKGFNWPNVYTTSKQVTELRKLYPHWAAVPSDTMADICWRVDDAFKRRLKVLMTNQGKPWNEREPVPRPRWADDASDVGLLFRGESRGTSLTKRNRRFGWWRLAGASKLGIFKARMHRAIPEGAVIREVHITQRAEDWYISFSCAVPAPVPLPPVERERNGVDLGCIHVGEQQRVAIVDDGRVYSVQDHLRRSQERKTTLQRLVDDRRKVKGSAKAADPKSKRTQKRRKKLAKLEARIARQREHVTQYIARRLVDTANTVALEKIDWAALRRQGKPREEGDNRRGGRKAKKGLNRAMSTANPGKLVALVKEKAQVAGRGIVRVNPQNTSQMCSACGIIGERKNLSVRQWTCIACGATHDRDVNAAKNIAKRALESS